MNQNVINEFYLLAVLDLENGVPIEDLKKALKMYEQNEDYLACAGILKAIKEYEYFNNRQD